MSAIEDIKPSGLQLKPHRLAAKLPAMMRSYANATTTVSKIVLPLR